MLLALADPFGEFVRDPWLTVGCVLLLVASVAWIVLSRLIVRNLKSSGRRRA